MLLQGPDTLAFTVAWFCVSFLDLAEAVRSNWASLFDVGKASDLHSVQPTCSETLHRTSDRFQCNIRQNLQCLGKSGVAHTTFVEQYASIRRIHRQAMFRQIIGKPAFATDLSALIDLQSS